jgi:hypothetical protein
VQQEQQAPPGTFKVQLPHGVQPNQMMQVQVPQGYPQAGQVSTFRVPPGSRPGGFVFAPLPTGAPPQGGQFHAPYGNGGYNNGAYGGYNQPGGYQQGGYYPQNNGPSAGGTALAAGAGALGGFLLADALFDF